MPPATPTLQNEPALLVVYAKNPVAGNVKTRLAKSTNQRFATNAYKRLLEKTVATAADYGTTTLAVSPDVRHGYLRLLSKRYGIPIRRQPNGNLGQRMNRSVRQGLRTSSAVMVIGSDCPGISSNTLKQVATNLKTHPYVACPAEDGGYVLVGCNCYSPKLFQCVRWSSPQVLAQTQRQARRGRKRLHLQATLADIDDIQDWRRARRQNAVAPLWRRSQIS